MVEPDSEGNGGGTPIPEEEGDVRREGFVPRLPLNGTKAGGHMTHGHLETARLHESPQPGAEAYPARGAALRVNTCEHERQRVARRLAPSTTSASRGADRIPTAALRFCGRSSSGAAIQQANQSGTADPNAPLGTRLKGNPAGPNGRHEV